MRRATLLRVLLASALVVATTAESLRAQQCLSNVCGPRREPGGGPPPSSDNNNRGVWYAVGGMVILFIGALIASTQQGQGSALPPPPPSNPPPPPSGPRGSPLTQVQLPPSGRNIALRPTCNLPPVGETRLSDNRIVLDIPANVSDAQMEAIARRHTMTRLETVNIRLTGRRLHLWRIDGGTSVADMIRNVCAERLVAGLQPNYIYQLAQAQSEPVNNDQYAPAKLNLAEAHRLVKGDRVLVAVIDSEVDASHPDLAGAIAGSFDAVTENEPPHSHGTGMAGAIVAHHNMLGTAPGVRLLTVRAFSTRSSSVEGTTFNILKGLDWAAAQGARVINMSFAGPADPRLRDALDQAYKKGLVLIAAAGNGGPKSPPMFPAADKSVIAVTATDPNDALFSGANRGDYVAVAAPGVDILAPAPAGAYQFTTGTSVASAEVSGIAALLLERNPALTPADVRRILMSTAKDLGPKGKDRDFGAGLVDAAHAVAAAKAR